jgi:hypothetical protein
MCQKKIVTYNGTPLDVDVVAKDCCLKGGKSIMSFTNAPLSNAGGFCFDLDSFNSSKGVFHIHFCSSLLLCKLQFFMLPSYSIVF